LHSLPIHFLDLLNHDETIKMQPCFSFRLFEDVAQQGKGLPGLQAIVVRMNE